MQTLLGNHKRGRAFVVSAPAGTGKTTLVEKLTKEFPCVVESVSYTTRLPRPGECEGIHYHFVSQDVFKQMILEGLFLEYVTLYDEYYGTSRQWVINQLESGKHVVLVIDTQGAMRLKGTFPATFIFIQPPSLEELCRRLERRRTESQEVIEKRLVWAKQELEMVKYYDYQIINDDFSIAYEVLKSILIAEEHKIN